MYCILIFWQLDVKQKPIATLLLELVSFALWYFLRLHFQVKGRMSNAPLFCCQNWRADFFGAIAVWSFPFFTSKKLRQRLPLCLVWYTTVSVDAVGWCFQANPEFWAGYKPRGTPAVSFSTHSRSTLGVALHRAMPSKCSPTTPWLLHGVGRCV